MRLGELIANLAGTAQAIRALAAIAVSLFSIAPEAAAQGRVYRIGIIQGVEDEAIRVLPDALRAMGYDVGRNLWIEKRSAQDRFDRIPALVAELVALRPDIIVAASPQTALAVHTTAPEIPLVFLTVADPVGIGLVPNLAHPGGNVTGIATMVPGGFAGKLLELLKMASPAASRIALLVNPKNPIHQRNQSQYADAARQLGVELVTVMASKVEELEAAFQEAHAKGAEAIDVLGDTVTVGASAKIANLTLQYRWPSIFLFRQNVQDGGLMSYGPNLAELGRSCARQIDKILKGANPGDLPVEQPTRFNLVINLRTAKALGITLPNTLLVQATEVIE